MRSEETNDGVHRGIEACWTRGRQEAPRLWELTLEQAIAEKWAAGRKLYGPTWQGRNPLIELYDELLDAINYEQESTRRGLTVPEVREKLREAARILRPILVALGPHLG